MRAQVTELSERLRFEVQSLTTEGDKRLVDMCEFEGNGQCSCWMFARQIKLLLEEDIALWKSTGGKKGAYVPREMYQCDHIQAVNHYIANKLVQRIRLAYPDDAQKI